jgi:SAM-dependent methyltransferase
MNHRDYWEDRAGDYEEEVFSVLANDRQGVVRRRIEEFAGPDRTAADLGCGIGHFLPLLSEHFSHVSALDFSERCLRRGRRRFPDLENVDFVRCDLRENRPAVEPVEFGLSVNALLTPDLGGQVAMFFGLRRHLQTGADLVLVVPSHESALFVEHRLLQWHLEVGDPPADAVAAVTGPDRAEEVRIGDLGVVEIDGVATKHYLEAELMDRLEAADFEVTGVSKVEYDWETEFAEPPEWMGAPYPWDWCATAVAR